MKYYTEDNKEIILPDDARRFDHGSFGDIYKIDDDTCFKKFHRTCHIDMEAMKTIKNLHLHHFDSIIDLAYDEDHKFQGFLLNTYVRKLPDFLLMTPDELKKIFYSLVNDVNILSYNDIMVCDLSYYNTLMKGDELKLIDYDLYRKVHLANNYIYNYRELMILWSRLFEALIVKKNYHINLGNIYSIFRLRNESIDEISRVLDRLDGYPLVLDYFKR